jgi:hypothetical protein
LRLWPVLGIIDPTQIAPAITNNLMTDRTMKSLPPHNSKKILLQNVITWKQWQRYRKPNGSVRNSLNTPALVRCVREEFGITWDGCKVDYLRHPLYILRNDNFIASSYFVWFTSVLL